MRLDCERTGGGGLNVEFFRFFVCSAWGRVLFSGSFQRTIYSYKWGGERAGDFLRGALWRCALSPHYSAIIFFLEKPKTHSGGEARIFPFFSFMFWFFDFQDFQNFSLTPSSLFDSKDSNFPLMTLLGAPPPCNVLII